MRPIPQNKLSGTPPTRPLLRYYGGKWEIARWIIGEMPKHKGYCEPFGGAASVLLQKSRAHTEIYNDLDGEVVNLFKVCREYPEKIIQAVSLTPVARQEFEISYTLSGDPIEDARRLLVRSFFGFSGVSTHGKTSSFNPGTQLSSGTSSGSQWRKFPDDLERITKRLAGVVIESRPAIELIERYANTEMLLYVDPPYVESTRGAIGVYRFEMTEEQHEELAEALNATKSMIILSGYRSELYDTLYKGWKRIDRKYHDAKMNFKCESLWLRNVPDINPELF